MLLLHHISFIMLIYISPTGEQRMKLVGNLKKQVEETKNKEEAKEVIEKAGMELTNKELDQVTGGRIISRIR
jgi:bacteriocin-like protein